MKQWTIKAISGDVLGSKWLVGHPTTDRMSLIPTLEEIRERLPLYQFEIIEYTKTTLDEIYPDIPKWNELRDFEELLGTNWRLENNDG